MGPAKSSINRTDVRPGLRFAWREMAPEITFDALYSLVLTGLLLFADLSLGLVVLTLIMLTAYAANLGFRLYRGLAAARDARDFEKFIESQYPYRDVDPHIGVTLDELFSPRDPE